MANITIPPAALEAAARAAYETPVPGCSGAGFPSWENAEEYVKDYHRSEAHAAALALLENWPGMREMEEQRAETIQWVPWRIKEWKYRFLHLPLTETDNDKA